MPPLPPTIALLTDFGLADWYVAAVKGRILTALPEARLVDISHGVPACNVEAGAFLLRCVLDAMPPATLFCCVVDPGVGATRRAVCGRIGPWGYSGPDNGLATPLFEKAGDDFALYEIASPGFRAPQVSDTFHGRDLFAPAAARLAAGADPAAAGPAVTDPVILPPLDPEELSHGLLARVMLVDHFGNLVTNIARPDWEARLARRRFVIRAGPLRLTAINRTFAQAREVEALAYWGSAGMLEVAVNRGSAAESTGLRAGDSIHVDWVE
ncbi:MAG: SAM-dependent chlorinase/fluorinase [bacterium]|nr:SAM-dependent chlorinase/fluorinase [bacterium]